MSKNQKSWKVEVAEAIEEVQTLDMTEDKGGYPTIHWLLASHMLRDCTEFERVSCLETYVQKIKRSFYPAIEYLRMCDPPVYVYLSIPRGKKCIEFFSIHPNENHARTKNTRRIKGNIRQAVVTGVGQIKMTDPKGYDKLTSSQKLLSSGELT